MTTVKPILLAEDNPRDAELALAAMEEHHIADKVVVCHDGAEVLDYLYCRGAFASRQPGQSRRRIPGSQDAESRRARRF